MVVRHSTPMDKDGTMTRGLDINVTEAQREAVAEWVWRSAQAKPTEPA